MTTLAPQSPVRRTESMPDGTVSLLEWNAAAPLDLIFLHATGFNAETYRPLLAPLSENHHIVAIDQRGHGLNEAPDGA